VSPASATNQRSKSRKKDPTTRRCSGSVWNICEEATISGLVEVSETSVKKQQYLAEDQFFYDVKILIM
jgi:hypothetical protein